MKKFLTLLCMAVVFTGCSFDDDDLWKSIDEIDNRVKQLEEKVAGMNTQITDMKTIVDALNTDKTVQTVTETAEGYTITFNDGKSIQVMGGSAAKEIPVVGIKKEGDAYYWTLTKNGKTEWLTGDNGQKLPVAGTTPTLGVDADGYWTVDNGNGPKQVLGADGKPIAAAGEKGDSFFQSVTQDENEVVFTLADGTEITVPKTGGVSFAIEGDTDHYFLYGESREFTVSQRGAEKVSITKPDGWKASLKGDKLTVTAPVQANTFAELSGEIGVIAVGKNGAVLAGITVSAGTFNTLTTFENVPEQYLAGPTSYGANLYDGYEGVQYIAYTDAASGLTFSINEDYGAYNFWNGGVAISQWNEMTTSDYLNQCSAFYSDAATGFGGNGGSKTFAVSNGASSVVFGTAGAEYTIDHLWVTNTTYAALVMKDGNAYSEAFGYAGKDWLKLTVTGYDKSGTATGIEEFYLADFRTPDAPGILTEWAKIDLTSLGKVHTLSFLLSSSDTGEWGMNTPNYFCLDDIAIRK